MGDAARLISDFSWIEMPATDRFKEDVLNGLAMPRKWIPPKYFYDKRGSDLFERITGLPEYYPTRVERSLLEAHMGEIAELVGRHCTVLEYGSGAGTKTR